MSYQAVTGQIQFTTALHIGTGRGGGTTDAPIRRRGDGQIVLPGTALAGGLRTLATQLAPRLVGSPAGVCRALKSNGSQEDDQPCGCLVCQLFGDLHPGRGGDETSGGRASRLWAYDALPDAQPDTFIRDNVGIDRVTGAAARLENVKFDTEIIPAGAVFNFRLELDADTSPEALSLLAVVLAEWQAGRANLGGRRSRGLGALKLLGVRYHQHSLATVDNLLLFLASDEPWTLDAGDEQWLASQVSQLGQPYAAPDPGRALGVARNWFDLTFDLAIDGPFLVNDLVASVASGPDHVALLDGLPQPDGAQRPILPGSSLRGTLRSHAERIARTLVTAQVAHVDDPAGAFLQRCPACNPVESSPERFLTRCDTLLAGSDEQNALVKRDELVGEENLCLSCWLFGTPRHGSRLAIADAFLKEGTRPRWKVVDFLAIDRFTGGALNSAKFDAAALWQPTFRVHLRLENTTAWEIGWLILVIRDLADGLIPVGFGTAKGFGRATATNFTIQMGYITTEDRPLDLPGQIEASGLYQVATWQAADWLSGWRPAAKSCVTAFVNHVTAFARQEEKLPSPMLDSYFGRADRVSELYPVMRYEIGRNG